MTDELFEEILEENLKISEELHVALIKNIKARKNLTWMMFWFFIIIISMSMVVMF